MFFAYIDPGTAGQVIGQAGGVIGMVVGVVIAAFATVGVFFRRALGSFFQRIFGVFKKK